MTDPQETTETADSLAHSSGEPDQQHRKDDQGSDVGGPAAATESTTEDAFTGVDTAAQDDAPDSQARNPL